MAIPSPPTRNWLLFGIAINILSHFLYGSEPALTRAMQTVHHWPTLLLVGMIHLLAFFIYLPRLIHRVLIGVRKKVRQSHDWQLDKSLETGRHVEDGGHYDVHTEERDVSDTRALMSAQEQTQLSDQWGTEDSGESGAIDQELQENNGESGMPQSAKRSIDQQEIRHGRQRHSLQQVMVAVRDLILGNWLLITYVVLVTFRVATNIYTPKLLTAFYVQLITLSNPFMVSIFSVVLIREKFTYHTVVAMFVMLLGGVLVLVGNSNMPTESGFTWTIDFSTIGSDLQFSDLFGIIVALISTAAMALSFVAVKAAGSVTQTSSTLTENGNSEGKAVRASWYKRFAHKYTRTYHPETLFLAQLLCLLVMGFVGSVIMGEDWTPVFQTDWTGIVVFVSLGAIFVLGGLCNIYMVQILGATNSTTTIPLRLISTLVIAGILMGEWLHSIAQVIGGIIVFVAVTWYLIMLRKIHQQEQQRQQQQQQQHEQQQQHQITDELCLIDVGVQCDLEENDSTMPASQWNNSYINSDFTKNSGDPMTHLNEMELADIPSPYSLADDFHFEAIDDKMRPEMDVDRLS